MHKIYKFDDIVVNSTTKKKPEEIDRLHYIGLEHIDSGTFEISRWGSDIAPIGDKLVMKKGDVLFGKRRAYQRKVAVAPFDGIFSAHGMVLRPKEDVICKEYFPFFISSNQFMDTAVRISVGGLSPTVNWKDLQKQEFELPTISQQRILAEKLWAAYNLKEAYKKMNSAIDEMVKSQFIEMFKGKTPNSKLRDWVDTNIVKVKRAFKEDDTIEYIDISSVNNTSNEIASTTTYLLKNAPSRAQQCVRKGDILLSTVRPNLKNIGVNHSDKENLVASTGFCILRPKKGLSQLIIATIMSDDFTNKMTFVAKGTNYPAFHDYDALDYPVYSPNVEELNKVTSLYKQADKSKFELKQAIDKIEKVMKSLLQ